MPTREQASASILMLGVLVGLAFLIAILAAFGSSYVAHAELQQAADLAAGVLEEGSGDAPQLRAERAARANGARGVDIARVDGGTRSRVRVTGRAPKFFGMAL